MLRMVTAGIKVQRALPVIPRNRWKRSRVGSDVTKISAGKRMMDNLIYYKEIEPFHGAVTPNGTAPPKTVP